MDLASETGEGIGLRGWCSCTASFLESGKMAYFGKYYSSRTPLMGAVDPTLGARRGDIWVPAADIYETEDGVVVLVELPGVQQGDIELHVEGDFLAVRGVRREICPHCKKSYRQMELRYGPFERALLLPVPVKEGTAVFKGGILEIFFPRAKKRHAGIIIVHIEE